MSTEFRANLCIGLWTLLAALMLMNVFIADGKWTRFISAVVAVVLSFWIGVFMQSKRDAEEL